GVPGCARLVRPRFGRLRGAGSRARLGAPARAVRQRAGLTDAIARAHCPGRSTLQVDATRRLEHARAAFFLGPEATSAPERYAGAQPRTRTRQCVNAYTAKLTPSRSARFAASCG